MLRLSRSARPRLAVALAASLALVTAATVVTATSALATPQSELESQQEKATRLEAQIEANGNRVSILDEQYTSAQVAIEKATNQIAADQAQLEEKARETSAVRDQLALRGAALYMNSGNPAPLAALDVTNAQELGSRSAYAGAAADQDRQLLDDVKVAVEQLGLQQKTLEKARVAAVKQRDVLDEARKAIAQATEEQQSLLAQVKGNIKTLVGEIQAQKEHEQEVRAHAAMEQRAREEALAAQRAADTTTTVGNSNGSSDSGGSSSGGSSSGSSGGSSGASDPNLPAPSSQAQVAIDTARAQLGKPYVYAGSGPDSFDCSGLTMYAWAAAGVSMSHNAEAQYQSLPHVAMSELAPGDLVFFGSPIHHVGIFVGGGTMIEAPYTGVDVRYHSIYRPDFAGAARP